MGNDKKVIQSNIIHLHFNEYLQKFKLPLKKKKKNQKQFYFQSWEYSGEGGAEKKLWSPCSIF